MAFGAEIGLIGSLISGVVGFVGQMAQGQQQADAAKYQAAVARNNQIIAQQNASQAAQAGAIQAQSRDFRNRAVLGAIEAGQGAGGIDIDSESSKQIRESTEQLGRFDTRTVMSNALQQARGYTAQAMNFGAEAGLAESRASNASTSGLLGGFGSLLGGATSFGTKWQSYQREGVSTF